MQVNNVKALSVLPAPRVQKQSVSSSAADCCCAFKVSEFSRIVSWISLCLGSSEECTPDINFEQSSEVIETYFGVLFCCNRDGAWSEMLWWKQVSVNGSAFSISMSCEQTLARAASNQHGSCSDWSGPNRTPAFISNDDESLSAIDSMCFSNRAKKITVIKTE